MATNKKLLIVVGCLGLVILRWVFPKLVLDSYTFYLILIAVVVLYLPNPDGFISDLFSRMKRFKHRDTEIELSPISEIEKKVKQVEETEKNMPGLVDVHEWFEPEADLKTKFLYKALEIEKNIKAIVATKNIELRRRRSSPVAIARELAEKGIIPPELSSLIADIWPLRNKIVHSEEDIQEEEYLEKFVEFADVANQALLKIKNSPVAATEKS